MIYLMTMSIAQILHRLNDGLISDSVLARSNAEIVGSNPTQGRDVRVYTVCVR
jgi:hypothetical protein